MTLRYEAFDFDSRVVVTPGGHGLPRRRLPRQAGAGAARGPRGAQPRVPAVALLRAARTWPTASPASSRATRRARRRPSPPDTQIRQFEGHSTFDDRGRERVRRGPPVGDREDAGPRARGPGASRHDPSRVGRPAAARRAQRRAERLVRRPDAARRRRRPARSPSGPSRPHTIPSWTRTPGRRLLAGRVSPLAAEGARSSSWTRTTRRWPTRVAARGHGRRRAGRAAAGEGRALGPVPALPLRAWPTSRRSTRPGPLLHPVRRRRRPRVFPIAADVLRRRLAPDARRVVPGPDGPHVRQRGLPGLARRRAPRRRARRRRSNHQHFDGYRMGADDRHAVRSRASASRASPSAAGSTPATSTSRAAPTRRRSRCTWSTPGRRSGRSATRRSSTRTTRFVDIHRPDGKPDLLQQIEHGALQARGAVPRLRPRWCAGIVDAAAAPVPPPRRLARRRPTT
ncbi:MAG: hypothetical protein MZV63_23550 [Marinilabiliales bacterium]|nr:hypothetical protein [Marinilabiliales bacterium]